MNKITKLVLYILSLLTIVIGGYFLYKDYKYNSYYFHTDVSSFYLKEGNYQQIKIKDENDIANYNDYDMISSDNNIVSIDENGFVKGNSTGEAIVTVISKKNNPKEEIVITVGKNYNNKIKAKDIEISKEIKLKEGENKFINYNVVPSNATNKSVIFESSNTNVARVNEVGKVIAVGEGTAQIKVKLASGDIEKEMYLM